MSTKAASIDGSTFCTLPRKTLPIIESEPVCETKCSTRMPSSSRATWARSPRCRTAITRSTDSRRARNSASVRICGRRREESRESRRRCRLASSRVEPRTPCTSFDGAGAGGPAVRRLRQPRLPDVHHGVVRIVLAGRLVAGGPAATTAATAVAGRAPEPASPSGVGVGVVGIVLGVGVRRPISATCLTCAAGVRLCRLVRSSRLVGRRLVRLAVAGSSVSDTRPRPRRPRRRRRPRADESSSVSSESAAVGAGLVRSPRRVSSGDAARLSARPVRWRRPRRRLRFD